MKTHKAVAHKKHRQHLWIGLLPALLVIGGAFVMPNHAFAAWGTTSTFLGKIDDGDGGPAAAALLDFPEDVTSDAAGNLFIADTSDHSIRKVALDGTITTLAGGRLGLLDGTGTVAAFNQPRGVATDTNGSVYIADTGNDAVRKVTADGVVTTLVSSGLNAPTGVAVAGTTLFIADTGNNTLKSVLTLGGQVTTVASGLNDPRKIAVTADGSSVYVADNGSRRVLRVTVATGDITVIAGSGTAGYQEGIGVGALFQHPYGIALDEQAGVLYVSDPDLYLTDRIRTINLTTGATSLFAVDTTQETMIFPAGLTLHGGTLFAAMSGLGIIRQFSTSNAGETSVVAGTLRYGSRDGGDPLFGRPNDLALTDDRRYLFLSDNNKIRRITLATKTATTIIGSVVDNYREGVPVGEGSGNLDEARFSGASGIAVNSAGTIIYVADRWNNRIRKIDLTVTPFRSSLVSGAGRFNGTGDTGNAYQEGKRCTQGVDRNEPLTVQSGCAYFSQPTSLALDPTEEYLYVSDSGNNRIRKVRISDGVTTLIAGSASGFADGTAANAKFAAPWGLALADDGSTLYVADRDNHRIRAIALATASVRTVAGAGSAGYREGIGTAAYFSFPRKLSMGADGKLYLTEAGSPRIRQVDPLSGLTKLVAGSAERGYVDGPQAVAQFNTPAGLAPETGAGVLYLADSANDMIRLVDIAGVAPYADPAPTVTSVQPGEIDKDWDKGSGLRVKVFGTGFRYGTTVSLYTYPARKTYVISSKELVVDLPLSKMGAGWYDVTVTNVDGQSDVLSAGLAVRAADDSVPNVFYSISDAHGITAFSPSLRGGFFVAAGNVWGDERKEIIAGTGAGMSPQVRIFSNTGKLRGQFYAYAKTSRTGVRIASCDLNGDGIDEIVTAPGPGASPLIKIFTRTGKAILTKGFLAFGKTMKAGVNVTCGDVNGDGRGEIIVSASAGGSSQVAIFRSNGKKLGTFSPYGKKFRGGITLALANTNGDRTKEILVAPESGKGSIQVFTSRGRKLSAGWYPFGKTFTGGISLAAGDTNRDGKDEIIVAPLSKKEPRIAIYMRDHKKRLATFLAYPRGENGVVIVVGDVNGDGVADILTAPASGSSPTFRMFHQNGKPL